MLLLEKAPNLKLEWSVSNPVPVEGVTVGSHMRARWVCKLGHEWEAIVKNRANGSGCPVCANRVVLTGYNDLATTHPELAKQWSARNPRSAAQVHAGEKTKAWWVGDCGHEWEQGVAKRSERGQGCIYCTKAGTTILPGFNDLATKNPELAKQWSAKNEKTPSEVFPTSATQYWWVGDCGHEWEASPANRTNNGSGCPFCAPNPKVLAGFNDLATKRPDLAAKWSPKNAMQAHEVTPGSTKLVLWQGSCGHEWEASANAVRGCPFCAPAPRVLPGFNDLATKSPETLPMWDWDKNTLSPTEVTFRSSYRASWVCTKGHTWTAVVGDVVGYGTGCPHCAAHTYVSKGERELADWVSGMVDTRTSDRTALKPGEIDILCPEQRVAIEFNGLYWHSEKVLGKSYHREKSLRAKDAGLQLIHVWEDDWMFRKEAVKKMLARKLGVSDEAKVNARQCVPVVVAKDDADRFLEENHVQGAAGAGLRIGLESDGELVAVVTFKRRKREGVWELNRFATSCIVRGGFSRLLRVFIRDEAPSEIVSFSDVGVSDGGVYRRNGFTQDGEVPPDYKYRIAHKREHKFNYRKARFKSDPKLEYVEGLTERELADLNKLDRVYDAGKIRWVLNP